MIGICSGRLVRGSLTFLVLVLTFVTSSAEARPVAGEDAFTFREWNGPPVPVRVYRANYATDYARVIIVLHGVERNSDRTFETWRRLAKAYGFIVVVPNFSRSRFPKQSYAQGRSWIEGQSSFDAIEPLYSTIKERLGLSSNGYTLFGHSAGAQFVHRFIMLHPRGRWECAIAANAGWYTMPTDEPYPYGLGRTGIDPDIFNILLRKRVLIELGEDDVDPHAEHLERNPEIDRQGDQRLERGVSFYSMMRSLAERDHIPFGWQLMVVPGLAHDSEGAAEAAAAKLAHSF